MKIRKKPKPKKDRPTGPPPPQYTKKRVVTWHGISPSEEIGDEGTIIRFYVDVDDYLECSFERGNRLQIRGFAMRGLSLLSIEPSASNTIYISMPERRLRNESKKESKQQQKEI